MKKVRIVISALIVILFYSCEDKKDYLKEIELIPVQKVDSNGKSSGGYTYIDLEGKQPFEQEFAFASFFSNGLSLVKSNETNRFMFINEEGEMVIDASNYKMVSDFSQGIAWGITWEEREKSIAFNTKGEILFTLDGIIESPFNEKGVAIYKKEFYGNEYGFVNMEGRTTDIAYPVVNWPSQGMTCVYKDDFYGAINEDGELIIPCEYKQPFQFDTNGNAVVAKETDGLKYGLINKKNEMLIEPKYTYIRPDGERYIFLEYKGAGKHQYPLYHYGWCDESGKVLIEPMGELGNVHIPLETFFGNGEVACCLLSGGYSGNQYSYINRKGETVPGFLPFVLASPYLGKDKKVAIARNGRISVLLNKKGEAVGLPFLFNQAWVLCESLNYGYPALMDYHKMMYD